MRLKLARLLLVAVALTIATSSGWARDEASSKRSDVSGRSKRSNSRGTAREPGREPVASTAELIELVRRAEAAASEAREEALRSRADYEALRQELSELRLVLNEKVSDTPQGKIVAVPEAAGADQRLAKIEEQVEINTSQIKEQAQTKVESESRFSMRLSGMILANFHYNSDDIQRTVPLVAPPPSSVSRGTFGSTFRQTRLGLAVGGPRVGGARLSGEIDFDFYGGTVGQVEGDVLGAFRIRTAYVRMDWERTSVVIGQEAPAISPRNPTSLAAVWYPALSGAGNLWQWRPQATVEHRLRTGGGSEIIVQGSFLPPFGESYAGAPLRGAPAYEVRTAWRRSLDSDRRFEIGLGGHYGRRDLYYDRKVNDYVVSSDWLIPIGSRLELSGEFYHGQAVGLGEQSGARIDRLYAFRGAVDDPRSLVRGVRSTGGWAQLSLAPRSNFEVNLAFGREDPENDDLRFGAVSGATRFKNQVGSANFIYQLRPTFLVSLEYRRLWTDYISGRSKNNHYNLAVAYIF